MVDRHVDFLDNIYSCGGWTPSSEQRCQVLLTYAIIFFPFFPLGKIHSIIVLQRDNKSPSSSAVLKLVSWKSPQAGSFHIGDPDVRHSLQPSRRFRRIRTGPGERIELHVPSTAQQKMATAPVTALVAPATLKLPVFYTKSPKMWFGWAEAAFATSIQSSHRKLQNTITWSKLSMRQRPSASRTW